MLLLDYGTGDISRMYGVEINHEVIVRTFTIGPNWVWDSSVGTG